MSILKQSVEIERFLKNPDPAVVVVLIYGPDSGLVTERAKILVNSTAGSLDDPFSIVRLGESDLSDDPGRLLDEANALTFGQTRRTVWIGDAGQKATKALELIDKNTTDALIVITADNLKPASKLRKFAESKKFAVAIPCYLDGLASLNNVLDGELKKSNLTITPDARRFFIDLLGADRQLSRREIEKLCLFAAGKKEITADDVRLISGDVTAPTLDSLCDAVGEGNVDKADRIYNRSTTAGTSPGAVIAQLIRHFIMLDCIGSHSARGGGSVSGLVKQFRPQIFYQRHRSVEQQINLWSHEDLKSALQLLQQAESQCRNSKLPTEAVGERALFSLSMSAKRRQRHSYNQR